MKNPEYDICLIGLGPAGIGFVQTLLDSNYNGKILCLEAGRDLTRECNYILNDTCTSCEPCNVISGIGGCSVISGDKISDYPAGSGLDDFYNSSQRAENILADASEYLQRHITLKKYPFDPSALDEAVRAFRKQNMVLKYYDVYTVDHESLVAFYAQIISRLKQNGHIIMLETKVNNIHRMGNTFEITTESGKQYTSTKVVLAVGKFGNRLLTNFVTQEMDCQTQKPFDIGIRLEFPSTYIATLKKLHGDLKLKYLDARTYCFSIDGKVAQYHLNKYFFTEGFSKKGVSTGMSNIGILFRIPNTDDQQASMVNKLLLKRTDKSINKTTYNDFFNKSSEFIRDLESVLGEAFVNHVRDTVSKYVQALFEGCDYSKIAIYYPEADLIETKIGYDTTFEISRNLYIVGSSTGIFRGILQAFASGQQCGKEIIQSCKRGSQYIYDALYGPIQLDSCIVNLLNTPELQRLREVRLCNINSLSITGGANINRYEHSLGTYHLANVCIQENARRLLIDNITKERFLQAALLHDIVNGPFGHSYEYLVSDKGYDPESGFVYAVTGSKDPSGFEYRSNVSIETIFWGAPRDIANRIDNDSIKAIGEMVEGRTVFGQILADKIDLDNIDNVYRMAYHMGITIDKTIPEKLAKAIVIKDNDIYYKDEALTMLWDWHHTREQMYRLLLRNPEEFSGKCMLTEAIDIARMDKNHSITWADTDYELLLKLKEINPQKVKVKYLQDSIDLSIDIANDSGQSVLESIDEYYETRIVQMGGKNKLFKNGLSNSKIIKIDSNSIKVRKGTGEILIKKIKHKTNIYKFATVSLQAAPIIARLMLGKLYGCVGIYASSNYEPYSNLLDHKSRIQIEVAMSKNINERLKQQKINISNINIALHPILDVNKTRRQFTVKMLSGQECTIGRRLDRLLVGVFIKNSNWSMPNIQTGDVDIKILNIIDELSYEYLANNIFNQKIRRMPLYGE